MQHPWARRLIAGPLLLWLALLQFPLPMRAPATVDKDTSVAHPCMHRACGCATASQCWTSCCCTTRQERITWARKNLGRVPAELATAKDEQSPARACCSKKKPAPKRGPSVVVLSQVRECQGLADHWTIFSIAVPSTQGPSIVTVLSPLEQVVHSIDSSADPLKADLPTPPPRNHCCAIAFA